MAEAVLKYLIRKESDINFIVESTGTKDYHFGENPKPKTMKVRMRRELGILYRKLDRYG